MEVREERVGQREEVAVPPAGYLSSAFTWVAAPFRASWTDA